MDEDKVHNWMQNNSGLVGKLISLTILVLGILLIIGAFKNWDWLFKPDQSYHNRWTTGQVSRYLGRNTARVVGFIGGVILVIAGGFWSYTAFIKK
ncbi:MAG TPA: Imm17 family immunity protein [Parafilimonas sp.]|nr:Imm17 family immunity protein [Parafilimonas sp.]